MAYATAELNLWVSAPGGAGGNLWHYKNTANDTLITQRAADFFADGSDKGMLVGDKVISDESTGVGAVLVVSAVTAGGAATAT